MVVSVVEHTPVDQMDDRYGWYSAQVLDLATYPFGPRPDRKVLYGMNSGSGLYT